MTEQFKWKYKGYLLYCDPQQMSEPALQGKFDRRLSIPVHSDDVSEDHIIVAAQGKYFATADEAAKSAFEFGRQWINDHPDQFP